MSNACSNSQGLNPNPTADLLQLIDTGGPAFTRRIEQFDTAKKAADKAKAEAERAAAHAQSEITRIRVYVSDIKRDAHRQAAEIVAATKAEARAALTEVLAVIAPGK